MESQHTFGKKVVQTTVVKTILETFKNMLLKKELKPGDRLPSEREMIKLFGVGKSSIREATKMLDAVGVIESKQGYGTFVCSTPKEDSLNPLIFQLLLQQGTEHDLLNFRKMYETGYTLMAMENMTEEDKLLIKEMLDKNSDIPLTPQDDADFHRAILRGTHNPYVIRTGEVLIELYQITLFKEYNPIAENWETGNVYHRKIYEAICAKDRQRLLEILERSYEDYAKLYIYK